MLRPLITMLIAASVFGFATPVVAAPVMGAEADTSYFPVVIQSTLGTATIEASPKRVVTLGVGADDIAISLGIVPIGISRADWGGDEDGYWPWVREALEAQDIPLPTTITQFPELDIEALLALEPDVILAPSSGIPEAIYDLLSPLVPVVAYPKRPYLTSVDEQIERIAKALGMPEKGDALRRHLQESLGAAGGAYPSLTDTTFAYVRPDPTSGNVSVYLADDPRVGTLTGLGLRLSPTVEDLSPSGNHFAHYLGFEHLPMLHDVELVVSWYHSEEQRDRVAELPLFASLPAISHGRYLALTDQPLIVASSAGSPLATQWMLERLLPRLAEAAKRANLQ
ncbi:MULTISPECIES: iron-siderophore ABC transporter substrate-binding protein [unclassified Halomonas]|uniref:iron-siderophore ABC transporter substrate-binding protein n=1 Tax=unclassified Halomonas TaxID=2609666 RepID=UPI00099092CB|nr:MULTISPECIES: iron-siderophore ABC transporter substrate-binding protein [unclassified Halomonas]AQU84197.1 ABC transporter substrate-binding protein [Halomonas sp. 'Soap Lake \